MEIKIDTLKLIQNGISADEYLLLRLIDLGEFEHVNDIELNPDLTNLVALGYIEPDCLDSYDTSMVKLTEDGKIMLDTFISDITQFCDDFRHMWENTKRGAMTSLPTVVSRMKEFKRLFPEFTEEDIMVAGQLYIHSLRGEYKFMLSAGNFILKDDTMGEYISALADWCEEAAKGEERYDGFTQA